MIQPDTYQLKVVFEQPILGSQPSRDVASVYLAQRNGFSLPEDEIETLPDALDKGTTVFHKDGQGRPVLWDYQLKGMLKAAAQVLNGKDGVRALKSKVNNLVFISPRVLTLQPPETGQDIRELMDYLERPLRAETAQGPRVALARSEMLPEGVWFRCGLTIYPGDVSEAVLTDLLDYGFYSGLGQWRNGGWGRFRYELQCEK
jgi:hypothetical protein